MADSKVLKRGGKKERTTAAMEDGSAYVVDKNRALIMTGLSLGLLLASLDQTIVGTSLPKIVADLGGLDRFAWLFSAYMLAATCMIPLAGKMSDRYGRRPVFLFGMAFFLGGSMLSGLAQDMDQLIIFRFIQGFGGGAMLPVAVATVADLYPHADRGKVQGILGSIFAVSSIIGPFIGGWIVDHISWRWVFYVNLPVGIAAILVTAVKFPKVDAEVSKPIDFLGIAAITTALSAGLLITFWGGDTYEWASWQILGLAAVSISSAIALVYIELHAPDPVLPLPLFRNSIFTLGCISLMLMAMGLFGVVAFLPMFLQAVIGISATYSGEVLIPLMLAAMFGGILSGVLLKRTGYKGWLVTGPLIGAAGLYLLSTLHSGSSMNYTMLYLVLCGLGLGMTMSNYIVAAQNVIAKKDMGVATSTMSLFRALGGTVGVTVFGVIVNRRMTDELGRNLPPGATDTLGTTDINKLGGLLLSDASKGMPPAIIDGIRESLSNSLTYVFFLSTFIVLAAWVVTLFIKSVPLKSNEEYMNGEAKKKDVTEDGPAEGVGDGDGDAESKNKNAKKKDDGSEKPGLPKDLS